MKRHRKLVHKMSSLVTLWIKNSNINLYMSQYIIKLSQTSNFKKFKLPFVSARIHSSNYLPPLLCIIGHDTIYEAHLNRSPRLAFCQAGKTPHIYTYNIDLLLIVITTLSYISRNFEYLSIY
jgi:hypothetical protein